MTDKPEVLTLKQAAELLQLCTLTVSKLAKAGKIPHQKIGREYRFARTTLMRWIDGNQAA